MTPPLVSVITATWRRPNLLLNRCIPSVWAQTYQPVEHLIVVDGIDIDLRGQLMATGYTLTPGSGRRLVELGRHWGGVGHAGHAAGALLAAGDYICYLDDDNEYLPDHVAAMVAEAERASVDIVCTAWRTPNGGIGGRTPPGTNHTDTSSLLHRADLLRVASWAPEAGYAADGALVDRWVAAGVPWSFLPEPTLLYHGARGGAPE
jgi:glycosyltransferase involved in cell wall biosynthesis